MINNFKICCFVTENTVYEQIAKEYLIASLDILNLDYDLVKVPNLGTWAKNTSYKPTFAKEMLLKHPNSNIVLLDADCRVLHSPVLFNNIPEDFNFAAHMLDHDTWYQNNSHKKELVSSALFLRNNEKTKTLVWYWEKECSLTTIWEQKVLQQLLKSKEEPIFNLPLNYCYIDTLPGGQEPHIKCDNVVIRQYQASRKTKRTL